MMDSSALPTPSASTASIDQFLNMELIDSTPVIEAEPDLTAGMNFAEMFRHYLAPEVAKLPFFGITPLPSPAQTHPYATEFPLTVDTQTSVDPNVFAYENAETFSPLEGFSPSSDLSGLQYGSLSPGIGVKVEVEEDQRFIFPNYVQTSPIRLDLSMLPALPIALPDVRRVTHYQTEPTPLPLSPESSRPRRASQPIFIDEIDQDEEEEEDTEMGQDYQEELSDIDLPKPIPSSVAINKRKTQKLAKTSVAAFASATLHPTSARSTLPPVPEWNDKPDPEAYKKLNSKEKRQLRNKISARNFRHRRKEYITTLEEEISSRDTIINELRSEVGSVRSQNKQLKSEVAQLSQSLNQMMEKMSKLSIPVTNSTSFVPTSLSAVGLALNISRTLSPIPKQEVGLSPSGSTPDDWALESPKSNPSPLPMIPIATAPKRAGTRGSNGITKPNLSKDVSPMAKRTNSNGTWHQVNGMGLGPNNYMPVHRMILPDLNPLAFKPFSHFTSSLNEKVVKDVHLPSTVSDLWQFQSPSIAEQLVLPYIAQSLLEFLMMSEVQQVGVLSLTA